MAGNWSQLLGWELVITQAIVLIPFIQALKKALEKSDANVVIPIAKTKKGVKGLMSQRLTDFPKAAEQVTTGSRNGPCI